MANTQKGTVVHILERKTGEGKNGTWVSDKFVIEFSSGKSNFVDKAVFEAFNNDAMDTLKVGDLVDVHFNLSAREHNGNWYPSCKVWKIIQLGAEEKPQPKTESQVPANEQEDDLPF